MSDKSVIRVLVSAIGGDVGQAIVKSLRMSGEKIICHGCDISDNELGKLYVNSFRIVPPSMDTDYIPQIDTMARDLDVDVFFPASEQEISVLAEAGFSRRLPGGTPVICQDVSIIRTFGDKLRCLDTLQGKVPLAPYADGHNRESVEKLIAISGFPLVIKERLSRGSKFISIVNNFEDLITSLRKYEFPLVQEYIDDEFGEFSIGIFSDSQTIESIAFRRLLGLTGASWYAETCNDRAVLEYARKITGIVSPHGSINIQVRKSSKGVRLLEINPRFSSLTAARAACGFNDAQWSVDLALNGTYNKKEKPFKEIRFKRYISELVDCGKGFEPVPEWLPKKRETDDIN